MKGNEGVRRDGPEACVVCEEHNIQGLESCCFHVCLHQSGVNLCVGVAEISRITVITLHPPQIRRPVLTNNFAFVSSQFNRNVHTDFDNKELACL